MASSPYRGNRRPATVQDRLWTKEQTIPCKSRDKPVSVIDLFRWSFHAGTVSHRDRIYGRTIFL